RRGRLVATAVARCVPVHRGGRACHRSRLDARLPRDEAWGNPIGDSRSPDSLAECQCCCVKGKRISGERSGVVTGARLYTSPKGELTAAACSRQELDP